MRIGIAFDLVPLVKGDGPDDRYEEFDKPETIDAIARVIRDAGHDVTLLGDGRPFLEKVLADPPDFVFNIAEGEGSGRCREARVPAVLEMLGIPYSGSDPLTLAACLDKSVAKSLIQESGHVSMPYDWVLPGCFASGESVLRAAFAGGPSTARHRSEGYPHSPLILKPAFEGSSKGIRGRCLAGDLDEALQIYRDLTRSYDQPVLVEQFIDGEEVTVGLVGNFESDTAPKIPEILGVMKVVPRDSTAPFVYSLDVKRDWRNRVDYEIPARFDDESITAILTASLEIFERLGCRDLARIDFRVRDGIPYFIEANPLPGLAPGVSDLVILAEGHGVSYDALIRKILDVSLTRAGLQ